MGSHGLFTPIRFGLPLLVGLALTSSAQAPNELTLRRIKAKMSNSYQRLPNFTCLQTIDRFRREKSKQEKHLGRLRLEVGFINGRDRFSWPSAAPFEGKSLGEIVPAGSLGAGTFAAPTRSVFLSTAPEFTYIDEEELGQSRCYRYDFRAAADKSKYHVSMGMAGGRVGYHGSFWVDADTLSPIRMKLVADELPANFSVDSATTVIAYEQVALKGGDFILPKAVEVTMVDRKGNWVREETVFSDCQPHPKPPSVQRAEVSSSPAPETAGTPSVELPAGLRLELIIETGLDSSSASLGDPVTAAVASNVKQDGTIIVPKGANAHGHLVALQPVPGKKDYVAVGLEFQKLTFDGKEAVLTAQVEKAENSGQGSNVVEVMGMVGARRSATYINSGETAPQPGVVNRRPETAIIYVKQNQLEKVKGAKIILRTRSPGDQAP